MMKRKEVFLYQARENDELNAYKLQHLIHLTRRPKKKNTHKNLTNHVFIVCTSLSLSLSLSCSGEFCHTNGQKSTVQLTVKMFKPVVGR